MRLVISSFKGMAPSLSNRQLGDGYSALSVNARTGRGLLEPYYESSLAASIQGTNVSFARHSGQWFSFGKLTSVTKAPLKNDPWDYAILAAKGQDPKVTYNLIALSGAGPYPAASRMLGVPAPEAVTIGTVSDASNWHSDYDTGGVKPEEEPLEDEYDNSTVSYVLVYVDAWGRLSAPSKPSVTVDIREYQFHNTSRVSLRLPPLADAIASGFIVTDSLRNTTAAIRVYRANYDGTGNSVYQFVDQVAISETFYYDETYSGDLQESTISDGWLPPPSTDTALFPNGTMEKVVVMGTDTLVGHNERILCFAEPEAIHAWPVEYYKVFTESIRTIASMGPNVAVLTDGHPYIIQGSHPASMEAVRLADSVPCASAKGVTEVYGSVFFASPLGLYSITGFNLSNISAPFATEREWKDLDPSTMVLGNYDGKVLISCPSVGFTYMFDPANASDGLRRIDFAPSAFAQMESTNDLAYCDLSESSDVYLFDDHATGNYRLLEWESKTYEFNAPIAFSAVKVRANSYPVTVIIENEREYGGSTRSVRRTLNSDLFGYLPDTLGSSKSWRIKVVSNGSSSEIAIRDIQLASSPEEFV